MPSRLVFRPAAGNDLNHIYDYIQIDNPPAAAKYIDDIEAACARLVDMPRLGRRYNANYFYIGARNHLIFYSYDADVVTIERIIHGKRDLAQQI